MLNELTKKVKAVLAIDTSILFKKTDYNPKIKDSEDKIPDHFVYISTNKFNNFFSVLFDDKLKITNVATSKDLATVEHRASENKQKIEKFSYVFYR